MVVPSRKCVVSSIRFDQVGIWLVDMKLIVRVYDILIRSITVSYMNCESEKAGRRPTEESACEHFYFLSFLIFVWD